jgi:hypothetical protein
LRFVLREPACMSTGKDKVVMFRPRQQPEPRSTEPEQPSFEMQRYPVDIRGNITFGRLMSGLATVGLTVRVDARSGRVLITDDLLAD